MLVGSPARLASVPVAPDAVLAEEAMRIDHRRWQSPTTIMLGKPFSATLPAGSAFSTVADADLGMRACLRRGFGVSFEPLRDDNGDIYPSVCLLDRDRDGRFEVARLTPYQPTRAATHDLPIAPIALREIEPGSEEPRIPPLVAHRRLRVGAVRPEAVDLVLEHAWALAGQPGELSYRTGSEDRATLPLRGGSQADMGGMGIIVEGGPGAWMLTTANGFAPWVALREGSTLIEVGPFVIGPVR